MSYELLAARRQSLATGSWLFLGVQAAPVIESQKPLVAMSFSAKLKSVPKMRAFLMRKFFAFDIIKDC